MSVDVKITKEFINKLKELSQLFKQAMNNSKPIKKNIRLKNKKHIIKDHH
jgi:hypothetical protein